MNEERKMILEMLKDGSISVEEAENLLDATNHKNRDIEIKEKVHNNGILSPKRLLVQVMENGKNTINVKIPFSLVRAGLKISKFFIKADKSDYEGKDYVDMIDNINIDEILDSLNDGEITLPYTFVDIDTDDNGKQQKVYVVLE